MITFNSANQIRESFEKIPLEKLLVETDTPYLAPVPYRGKTNEPSYVVYVAKALSQIKGVDFNKEEKLFSTLTFLDGSRKIQKGTNGIYISTVTAEKLKLNIGDNVLLMLKTVNNYTTYPQQKYTAVIFMKRFLSLFMAVLIVFTSLFM